MAHPNEEVLRTAYNAFSKGDMETANLALEAASGAFAPAGVMARWRV